MTDREILAKRMEIAAHIAKHGGKREAKAATIRLLEYMKRSVR